MNTMTRNVRELPDGFFADYTGKEPLRGHMDGYCHLCGKDLDYASAHWVMVVDGGNSYAPIEDEKYWQQDYAAFMGCFPVGPTCAQQFHGWAKQVPELSARAQAAWDYDAVSDWARTSLETWQQRKQTVHNAVLPRVRYRMDEYERGTVGHLGFDTWNRTKLTLDYSKSNHRPGHMRISADDIAKGRVQAKVGARYVDIREVIADYPDGVIE